MTRHQVPELLRRVSDLTLPVSPSPSRFLRHADAIDPIAEAYAEIYRALYGLPVRAEALERFLLTARRTYTAEAYEALAAPILRELQERERDVLAYLSQAPGMARS
ncbi:MAG: hypothetical protein ACRERE_40215 [Candidatus Entotheonellia bacterium]